MAPPTASRPGLRLQILLAIAGVILVAYVPLFFAIAQVTRATSQSYREETAHALGRAVAAHVGDVRRTEPTAVSRVLASHIGEGGALAIAVYDANGAQVASAGPATGLAPPPRPFGERSLRSLGGRALDVVLPAGDDAVLVRVSIEEDAARSAAVVRGIALYMTVFALALLVFAYIVLTRTIVRPIEQLSAAAERVARGARALDVPAGGAREITDLGATVRSMAARLLAEEEALRAKVEELTTTTKSLGETREQLQGSERMASVGRLAAGVAHEIGNPIAAIMGLHDLLDDETALPPEDRADFLKRMRKETERINVVVRDLLDYARPEDSGPQSGISSANALEIVNDTLALVRPQKEWKGMEVDVDVPSDLRVVISPQRLTQVLLNLLLNAASALGGREQRTIRVRGTADGTKAQLIVEDDGPGVPASIAPRIFDPFVTTKEVGEGTGLGLAVCRGIVEGVGGRLRLDADYTDGARFVIELNVSRSTS